MSPIPMRHPAVSVLGEAVDEQQFEQVWASRGWVRADPAVVAASDTLGVPLTDLDALTKEQLVEVAANQGVNGVVMSQNKEQMVKAISAALQPEPEES